MIQHSMVQEKEYFAFISYQRKDEEWADRLRCKLEHYHLPSNLRKNDSSLPKDIRPIFRDALELAGGVLADEIQTALRQSKYLIVICSPNSAQSPWVNKEVQSFIDLGRETRIIPFIIDGTPFSNDPATECFPLALRSLKDEKELLGININELGRDAAAVKVVARMFGLNFDTLWQRYEREKRKKRWLIIGLSVLFALVSLGIGAYIARQNKQLESANHAMQVNLSRILAEKALALADEGDTHLANMIALQALPPNRPYTAEAEAALRQTVQSSGALWKSFNGWIKDIAISSDGKQVVSVDGQIRLWDFSTGKCKAAV